MAYGDCQDVTRKSAFDKILHDKAFNIAKNWEYDGYQGGLASMVYIFLDKGASGEATKNKIRFNEELAEELYKPTVKKLEKRKLHLYFIDNIWGADPADMQLIDK